MLSLIKKYLWKLVFGGGSSDAAECILALNKLFKLNLTNDTLLSIGKKIGADVNPCICRHTLLAEGIGDKVTEIKSNTKLYLVIIKPKISCSTKDMFKILDSENDLKNDDRTNEIKNALIEKNIFAVSKNIYNDFEIVTNKYSEIIEVKKAFEETNALNSMLTGSGSCVFGIYESKKLAKEAYKKLKEKYEAYYVVSF